MMKPVLIGHCGDRRIRTSEVERQQIYSLSHLATLVYPLSQKKSRRRDSNPRPADYKSAALPAELLRLFCYLKELPLKKGLQMYTKLLMSQTNLGIFYQKFLLKTDC